MTPTRLVAAGAAFAVIVIMETGVAQGASQGRGAEPAPPSGQAQRGGQGQAIPSDPNAKVLARVRVPSSHASIHSGPSTGNEVLVMAPKGTALEMIGRRGEWIQVRLPPELRKTGIEMRWYKNETSGWMHDSTVEFLTPEARP